MTPHLLPTLKSLRDVEGVLGSFLWLEDGRVIASDVPAGCPDATLEAVARRAQRLCEAFVSVGDRFESTTLAYAHYKLHVCMVEWSYLGVIVSSHVNRSALEMAVALARREVAHLLATGPMSDLLEPDDAPEEVPPDAEGTRSYRGLRVSD
jgi:predicted regulator of Ras-like GTPase activity (Roadblock/LC7/MglB family)